MVDREIEGKFKGNSIPATHMFSDQEAPIPVILKQSNVFLFLFGRAGGGIVVFQRPPN